MALCIPLGGDRKVVKPAQIHVSRGLLSPKRINIYESRDELQQ